ncbi:MAG: hypothetical protein GW893_07485 [Armatimonadetes bacterium]|nr:hypothetical protein [Armatimonadota bacterium]
MGDRVRLAIVGCGGIAGAHLNGYESLHQRGCDAFEIVTTCDTNIGNAGQVPGRGGRQGRHVSDADRRILEDMSLAHPMPWPAKINATTCPER